LFISKIKLYFVITYFLQRYYIIFNKNMTQKVQKTRTKEKRKKLIEYILKNKEYGDINEVADAVHCSRELVAKTLSFQLSSKKSDKIISAFLKIISNREINLEKQLKSITDEN